MKIRYVMEADKANWLALRQELWPETPPQEHEGEIHAYFSMPDLATFVAIDDNGDMLGFLEAGLRSYGEGCASHPVAYVEGWYVLPSHRRQGVGRRLMDAAEEWALDRGLREIGSDMLVNNEISLKAHTALGYTEVERLIHVVKKIDPA
ncbi:GNAT family N-acetyltransferase [Hahella sp. HN01]|uniref:GNAT family N-acetyltransferase n=1 Tax=Hahella sp. HN01 TaxID=2847262 RepID=UPI001C1EB441|nr:GNAT family N-acetyltransferase [Hahella sp. HN01]MBU6953321.1 GNAT family N-acetyltransferase [Hahella sp. HN01]